MQINPSTKTILVCHPDPVQAQLWQRVLQSQGHAVLLNEFSSTLLEYLSESPIDMLVLDITSGGFNPYAVCRKYRQKHPTLPLILVQRPACPIGSTERRWAIQQGATEVVPGLSNQSDIPEILQSIYVAAGWKYPLQPLVLEDLDDASPTKLNPTQPEGSEPVLSTPPPKKQIRYRGRLI